MPELGEVRSRRVFATVVGEADFPDGMAVDAEGVPLWVAHWGGSRISRDDPDGKVERVVPMPVPNVTSLAFAGPELTTLYITTAREGLSTAQLEAMPEFGGLYRLDTDIQGLVEPIMPGWTRTTPKRERDDEHARPRRTAASRDPSPYGHDRRRDYLLPGSRAA